MKTELESAFSIIKKRFLNNKKLYRLRKKTSLAIKSGSGRERITAEVTEQT